MASPAKLVLRLAAVTPLFLGGADPNARAELRPPSIKGLLRYWYRAVDGGYGTPAREDGRTREEVYFGSTGTGQSACLLRVDDWREGGEPWRKDQYRRFDQGMPPKGSSRPSTNGISYLGFSLAGRETARMKFPASFSFTLEVLPRPGRDTQEVRRAWLASIWLLVHVGGVGARSRRGFGSLRIERWEGWPECQGFALPCQASTPEEWKARMDQDVSTLHTWFVVPQPGDRTVIAPGAKMRLLRSGHKDWESALNEAGLLLQDFRSTVPLQDRVGFGLPLQNVAKKRMGSPLFIRVVRLGQHYYPAFASLPAPPPPSLARSWTQGEENVVNRFLSELDRSLAQDTLEVQL